MNFNLIINKIYLYKKNQFSIIFHYLNFKYFNLVAAIMTIIIHTDFKLFDLSWSYSIWLEAFAIYP